MIKKTLGGDRLGSGKKMQVEMHSYERSSHDLSFVFRSTMAPGTLVPFMCDIALPGDTWDIELDANVLTLPTIGPLFGSFKVQLDLFETPFRLYHAWLHNNKLNIGRNMASVKLPLMELTAYNYDESQYTNIDNAQINPSCILSYLGIRGVGSIAASETPSATRRFHAVKLLGYWDIYKNYYANKQEEIGAVIHTGAVEPTETVDTVTFDATAIAESPTETNYVATSNVTISIAYTGTPPVPGEIVFNTNWGIVPLLDLIQTYEIVDTGTALETFFDWDYWGNTIIVNWRYVNQSEAPLGPPRVQTFPLANIDTAREEILERATSSAAVLINDFNLTPYDYVIKPEEGRSNMLNTQEGLAVKTYQSDVFNAWLDTEWIDGAGGITQLTAISTAGGSFTIDTLNFSQKLYDIYNRIAVSGGSFDDWMDAVYATERYTRCESPIYHGGLSKELIFQEVVSTANAGGEGDGSQPLGTLAGRGMLAKKHKGGRSKIRVQEPSYIWGIVSLTPRIDYSQGNRWDTGLLTMDDLHQPGLDQIGFQESINEYRAWWSTNWNGTTWVQTSAGKQPAWIDYMTDYNRTYGNFAVENNQMFMTLNRRFEFDKASTDAPVNINDLTTYIDPSKFNFIFAQTEIDAQNFWVQIGVGRTVRRIMSGKLMPTL